MPSLSLPSDLTRTDLPSPWWSYWKEVSPMQSAETFPATGPWCVQLTLRSLRYLNHECAESILKSGLGIPSCSQLSTWAHGWSRETALMLTGGSWTLLPSEHTLDSDRLLDSCKQPHLAGVWDITQMWNILGFYEVCHICVVCIWAPHVFHHQIISFFPNPGPSLNHRTLIPANKVNSGT